MSPIPDEQRRQVLADNILDYQQWNRKVEALMPQYAAAQPFPHVVLNDLLHPELAKQLEIDVPGPGEAGWTHYKHFNERKQGKSQRDDLPASILRTVDELNSEPFRKLLSRLTGIEGLMPDLDFSAGGGLSMCQRGGFLNIHTDFTVHPRHPQWRRRVNLIFYLNHDWDDAWGGHTELWDDEMRNCVRRIPPHGNSALVFSTDPPSFHGHPDPMQCPEGVARKTLALYYFAVEDAPISVSTEYKPRPSDGPWKQVLIYADRQLVRAYHFVKQKIGISDAFASRVLLFLERLFRR